MTTLYTPLKLGALNVPNRIFMAPLTRCRANLDHVPTDLMVEYYTQRASAGLIIAEATMAIKDHSSFWTEPGIYSTEQIAGWKKVTDSVHRQMAEFSCNYGMVEEHATHFLIKVLNLLHPARSP